MILVCVVPHAGDVDRNLAAAEKTILEHIVVPHAGDVDRNAKCPSIFPTVQRSSPTRGTWIEMLA